jgi:hypothetical protein
MAYGFRDDYYFFLKILLPQDPRSPRRSWAMNQKSRRTNSSSGFMTRVN